MSYEPPTPFPLNVSDDDNVEYDYTYYSDDQPFFDENSQIFSSHHINENERDPDPLTMSEDARPNDSIAFSTSIDHSKQLIFKTFGIHSHQLRTHPIPGLVVMPLKDFGLIRKDHRHHRSFPHFLVLPVGDNFPMIHPDFAQAIEKLHH